MLFMHFYLYIIYILFHRQPPCAIFESLFRVSLVVKQIYCIVIQNLDMLEELVYFIYLLYNLLHPKFKVLG